MTTSINTSRPLSQRTARTTLALASVLALSAIGAGTASAQTPSTPAAPVAPVSTPVAETSVRDVSVKIDDRDEQATEGRNHRYEVDVRNDGSSAVSDVEVRVELPDEYDVEDTSDDSRVSANGSDELEYRIGDLAPGESVTLTVDGEFEGIHDDEDLKAEAQVRNSASGDDEDSLEVRVEER